MEEIVTIDGKQYKLTYDQPLIAEQKVQVIADIRKQLCETCDQRYSEVTYSGGNILTLQAWLSGWKRRKSKTINGTTAGIQTDYQMKLTIHKGSGTDTDTDIYLGPNVRDDFGDVRFTSSDGSTLLNYYMESITGTAPDFIATIWVRIDSIPASPGTSTFYIYYDNPITTITTSNLDATFLASDMTALTKIDPNNKIAIDSSSKATFTDLRRDEIAYLYKSIPSTLDYKLDMEYVVTGGSSSPNDDGQINFAGVSDTLNVLNNTINSLYIRNYNAFHVGIVRLYMMATISGIGSPVPPGDNYASTNSGYITITRIGTTVTMNVYTDAARTIHAEGSPRTDTVSPAVGMTYAIPLSSDYYADLTASVSGYIQDLRIRKYTSPEPTFGSSGVEEPNIVTIAITPSVTTCTAPCNMTVDITWTNNGGTSGTFIPTITVNGTPTALPEESLGPSLSTTKTFSLTGLMAGTYNICSDPNTFPCTTVTVLTPANIVTTAITPSVTTCTEPCDLTVNITWTNTGGVAGTFTPTMVVDGTSIPLATPETLDPTQSVTKTFTVTNLMKGSHTICASPDTGVTCATITVEQVVQAGFGTAGMIIVAGLVIGAIYATTKKPKTEITTK